MKKTILLFFGIMALLPAFAQLQGTRWAGAIKGDNPRNALLDFHKDTVILYSESGSEKIETMIYTISGQTFSVKKINGQSDCDDATPGKYEFKITGDKMVLKLANDPCDDRSSALDATLWLRMRVHRQKLNN